MERKTIQGTDDGIFYQGVQKVGGQTCHLEAPEGLGYILLNQLVKQAQEERLRTKRAAPPPPGAAQDPRLVPTVSGEDIAQHRPELRGGGQLPQDVSQALGGCTKEWKETGERPTFADELS